MRFLIVGYGNTLRSDDGLGPLVVADLDRSNLPPGVEVNTLTLPQLDVSLIVALQDTDVAIFVDARQDRDEDLLHIERITPTPSPAGLTHSTHSLGLSTLISITFNWYGQTPCCYLIKAKGYDFSIRETLSEKGCTSAAHAEKAIYQIIQAHSASPEHPELPALL